MDRTQLSIVVAVYNEISYNLHCLIERLEKVLGSSNITYEIIFVNDGSAEQTSRCLEELVQKLDYLKLVCLSRNFGQQAAISAGIDFASGQAVITMDSDLQDPPEAIPDMVHLWQAGSDVVYAKRSSRKDKFLRRLEASVFYHAMSFLSSIDIPRDTGEFRLMDRRVVELLKQLPERTRYIRGLIPWIGFDQAAVAIDRDARQHGNSSYTISKLMGLALDGILSFSFKPLYAISVIGAVLMSMSCLVPLFCRTLLKHHPTVLIWSISGFLFVSGLQILLMGFLSLYVAKILVEVRHRPIYVVSKLVGRTFTAGDK